MSETFYCALIAISRLVGLWIVSLGVWSVATCYFLLFPRRVAVGLRFYQAAFPEAGFWRRLNLVWRQFHQFAGLFVERLRLNRGEVFDVELDGFESFKTTAETGQGGVLLMSHLGSWEIAARLFCAQGARLMLFLSARPGESVERQQKTSLMSAGVKVVITALENRLTANEGAFDALLALNFVRAGGFVSFAGDRRSSSRQRAVTIDFLGHKAVVPAGPHLFALASQAALFAIFAVRVARQHYRLLFRPIVVDAGASQEARLQQSARVYGRLLQTMVRFYPTSWYHFGPFLQRGSAADLPVRHG